MGIICAIFKSSEYSLSRIHALKRSDKNLEIVVPASLRYLIGMSFIGTAFFASKLLITFSISSGQWEIRKKMSEGLMLEKSLVRLELFFLFG